MRDRPESTVHKGEARSAGIAAAALPRLGRRLIKAGPHERSEFPRSEQPWVQRIGSLILGRGARHMSHWIPAGGDAATTGAWGVEYLSA